MHLNTIFSIQKTVKLVLLLKKPIFCSSLFQVMDEIELPVNKGLQTKIIICSLKLLVDDGKIKEPKSMIYGV
jgi:hypothetical protein